MGARLLLATAQDDKLVPIAQQARMQAARPDLARSMVLATGPNLFVHAGVSQEALDAFYAAEAEVAG